MTNHVSGAACRLRYGHSNFRQFGHRSWLYGVMFCQAWYWVVRGNPRNERVNDVDRPFPLIASPVVDPNLATLGLTLRRRTLDCFAGVVVDPMRLRS